MKTIEEKAKAYDEALERGRKLKKTCDSTAVIGWCEYLIPELKESGDEQIRKHLLKHFQNKTKQEWNGMPVKNIIAWLEKQVAQKPIMIQWTGDNLKEIVHFTGKSPKFEEWFKTWEDFENYVHTHNNIFKIFNEDGSHIEIPVGAWIVKTPDGYNVASRYVFKQKPADKVKPKFKVTYAGSEYNILKVEDIAGEIFYGIEDEPNHIDYVKAENCEIISDYIIKENGSPYPTKPAVFSEQNPIDKTEPKFHEGEWITNGNYTWKIVEVKPLDYILQSQDGNIVDDTISHVDEHFHSFIIEDAQDGDVLTEGSCIFIFKELNHEHSAKIYCCWFNDDDDDFDVISTLVFDEASTYPATKEQRELLFQKMKEAGYNWDAEKKELKKLAHQEVTKVSDQETSAWSKEDDRKIETLLSIIFDYAFYKDALDENKELTGEYAELDNWLQSIPERFNLQPKQEWSEEDKARIKQLFGWLDTLKNYIHYDAFVSLALRRKRVDEVSGLEHWIKSLKDRVQLHNK